MSGLRRTMFTFASLGALSFAVGHPAFAGHGSSGGSSGSNGGSSGGYASTGGSSGGSSGGGSHGSSGGKKHGGLFGHRHGSSGGGSHGGSSGGSSGGYYAAPVGGYAAPVGGYAPYAAGQAAYLNVRVPEDAKVYLQDQLMTLTGAERRFVTPELTEGQHVYNVRVEVVREGKTLTKTTQATVMAGQEATVAVAFDGTGDQVAAN